MYILKTQLKNFRFNSIIQKGPFNVVCYKLSEEDGELEGMCMSHEELTALTNYVVNNKDNFGSSNYHNCEPDDCPYMTDLGFLPAKGGFPKYLITRNGNKIGWSAEETSEWTEIELLTDNGNYNHSTIPFNLIFKLEY